MTRDRLEIELVNNGDPGVRKGDFNITYILGIIFLMILHRFE